MSNKYSLRGLRDKYLSPSLSLSYNQPLHLVRGNGQYLYDEAGREYLDAVNNIQHIGHCHPKVCLLYTSPSPPDGILYSKPTSA